MPAEHGPSLRPQPPRCAHARARPHACPPSRPRAPDLREASAWALCEGVGNPASVLSNEMRVLFDAAFRGDSDVRATPLWDVF